MNISNITPVRFTGAKEARRFRKEAEELIKQSKELSCPFDYIAREDEKTPSFQTRLKKLLFITTETVGKDFANSKDNKLLTELKKIYVEQEEIQDYYNSTLSLYGKYQDRRKDVLDITF